VIDPSIVFVAAITPSSSYAKDNMAVQGNTIIPIEIL
jgi:hypothetical protein